MREQTGSVLTPLLNSSPFISSVVMKVPQLLGWLQRQVGQVISVDCLKGLNRLNASLAPEEHCSFNSFDKTLFFWEAYFGSQEHFQMLGQRLSTFEIRLCKIESRKFYTLP